MSKGLQYPIVFLPYFYELDTSKTDTKLKVYDVNSSHLTLLPQDENFKLGYKEEKYIDESGKEKTRNKLVNMTLTNEKSNGKDIKSTKLERCVELVEDLISKGEKVVVFSTVNS